MSLLSIKKKAQTFVCRLNIVGMIACLSSVFVVAINVILRKLTDARISIPGSGELSAYLMVVICMLAIPALYTKNGHIAIPLVVDRLPRTIQKILRIAVLSVEAAVCGLFTYAGVIKVINFIETGTRTDILNVYKWPFSAFAAFGFAELTLLIILDLCTVIINKDSQEDSHE